MAISKLNFNSLNVTPSASSAIGFDSGADDLETGAGGGSMNFIKKLTASSSSTLSFVDGASSVVLDSTYKEYMFIFNNIHPATNNADLMINFSIDSGSNYNVTKTSTHFRALHNEGGTESGLAYDSGSDMAQGTGDLNILLIDHSHRLEDDSIFPAGTLREPISEAGRADLICFTTPLAPATP